MPKSLKRTNSPEQREQHREFVKAAREIGCDDDPAAFDKMLKKLASAPPPKSVQKRKTSKKAKAHK